MLLCLLFPDSEIVAEVYPRRHEVMEVSKAVNALVGLRLLPLELSSGFRRLAGR
jgi:hypothetical protein